MNEKVAGLLNQQIQKELYSAYLYLDMANYYGDAGLAGFENWFYVQAKEEMDHAMLLRNYLLRNGVSVKLLQVDAPQESYSDFRAPLQQALEHERFITASINTIYEAVILDKDYRTIEFLSWFVKEQGEEEKNVMDLLKQYDLFGQDPKALYQMNQELATRVYAPPSLVLEA